jgi:hypothetical protein
MNVAELVERMVEETAFLEVMNNPLSQFGTPAEPFLGAELMPERLVEENAWVEEGIRFVSNIANDSTRYSPVQLKEGAMIGSFQVVLGNSDIGSEFTGQHYDALVRLLKRFNNGAVPTMDQLKTLINWVDTTLNMPLRMKNELYRWQAIVEAQVLRSGDNGYREVVTMPNPTGQRTSVGGTWSDNAYDPFPDIVGMIQFLNDKGFIVRRVIASTTVRSILLGNTKVNQRAGVVSIMSGSVVGLNALLSVDGLADLFRRNGIPPIETYDTQYRTQNGAGYYLPRDVMVFVCSTGRSEENIPVDERDIVTLENTIGYIGVGRAAGQSESGRALFLRAHEDKPPRIEGQAWQTSGPIVYEPEAFAVLTDIE